MHDKLTRHYRVLLGRILVSVSAFSIFFALNLTLTLAGTPHEHAALVIVLLVGAFLVLPRRAQPRILLDNLEQGAMPAEEEERWYDRFARIQTWVNVTRVIFFFAALFTFLVLPELI